MRRRLRHFACALLCLAATGSAWAQTDGPPQPVEKTRLLAAQEPNGLWVVVPKGESGFQLLHQPPQAPRDTLYKAIASTARPIALAATADAAHLVYDDKSVQSISFTLLARQGMHDYTTRERMPLPARATLLGFTVHQESLVALLAEPDEEGRFGPKLLAYRKGAWEPIELPQALRERGADATLPNLQLVVLGETIALIDPRPADGLVLYKRQADGWASTRSPRASATAKTRAVGVMGYAVLIDPPKPSGDAKPGLEVLLNATLLNADGRVLDAGALPLPASPDLQYVPMAQGDNLRVVSKTKEGNLFVTERSLFARPADTAAFAPLKVAAWPPVSSRELVVTGLLIVMTLVIIAMWRRDPAAAVVRLPEGLAPAALPVRLSAALFDMAPAVVVSMVVFKMTNPLDVLLPWPSFDQPLDQMLPGVVAFGLFAAHTTIGELLTGTTLGKRVMHCHVTSTTGEKPAAVGVLIRGVVRLVELFAWPLLLFVLLNRPHQRMGDLAARTVVVMHAAKGPAQPPRGE